MDFQIPRIAHEEIDENRGIFVIEPLDRGFGYTFGNSLRRVLLSSLEGAAVTAVKIEGVAHEFTTLPGVREDVTDIILNLKNLICNLHGESPEVEVHIAKKGAGPVTAADIQAPADLEILNPELELAQLAEKGKLEMTLTIGRGRGYVPAELNRGPEQPIGVIPIDSIFSPVRRVSYDVEAARVGQRTDYDKLRLDVTTDGSIEPREAIGQAADILIRQLAIFTDLEYRRSPSRPRRSAPSRRAAVPARWRTSRSRSSSSASARTTASSASASRRSATSSPSRRTSSPRSRTSARSRSRKSRRRSPRRAALCGGRVGLMKHARAGKKLGRDAAHRRALYSNLAGALFTHGRIETTEAKAKAVKPFAEKMITLGKRGDLHARRQALSELRSQNVVHDLFAEVAPRFADRPGGYTRIIKLGQRQGDAAEMVYLELVDYEPESALAG